MLGFSPLGSTALGNDIPQAAPSVAGFPKVMGRLSGVDNTSATSHTITMPSGVVNGETLAVIVTKGSQFSFTPPYNNNWRKSNSYVLSGGVISVFYKIADGTDTLTVTSAGASTIAYQIVRISGGYRPWAEFGNATASTNQAPPSISPDARFEQYLVIAGYGYTGTSTASLPPSGYDNLIQNQSTSCGLITATALQAASTLSPSTFTNTAPTLGVPFTLQVSPVNPATDQFPTEIAFEYTFNGSALTSQTINLATPVAGESGLVFVGAYANTTMSVSGGNSTGWRKLTEIVQGTITYAAFYKSVLSGSDTLTINLTTGAGITAHAYTVQNAGRPAWQNQQGVAGTVPQPADMLFNTSSTAGFGDGGSGPLTVNAFRAFITDASTYAGVGSGGFQFRGTTYVPYGAYTTSSANWINGQVVFEPRPLGKVWMVGATGTAIAGAASGTTSVLLSGLAGGLPSNRLLKGDMILVSYSIGSPAASTPTPTINTAGYTTFTVTSTGSTSKVVMQYGYKFITSAIDTDVQVAATGNNAWAGAVNVMVFRGVDPTTPFAFSYATSTATGATQPTPPLLTGGLLTQQDVLMSVGAKATSGTATGLVPVSNSGYNYQTISTDTTSVSMSTYAATLSEERYPLPPAFTGGSTGAGDASVALSFALNAYYEPNARLVDFSTNNLQLTGLDTWSATAAIVTGIAGSNGTYVGRIPFNATTGFQVTQGLSAYGSAYAQTRFKISITSNPTVQEEFGLLSFRTDEPNSLIEARIVLETTGAMALRVWNLNAGSQVGTDVAYTPTGDGWDYISLGVNFANNVSGTAELRLNGNTIISGTGLNTASLQRSFPNVVAARFDLQSGPTPTSSGFVYIDSVQYDLTGWPAVPARVSVTGVSSSGQVGTLTASGTANVSPTGVSGTGQVGTVTVTTTANVSVSVTGVSSTGSVGTVTPAAGARVSVTGVSSTGQTGAILPTGSANTTPTGVSGTGQVGTPTIITGIFVTPTGVSATGASGTVTPAAGARTTPTGVSATGQVGTVTPAAGAIVSVTGVSSTGQVGTVTPRAGASVSVTGISSTGQVGSILPTGTASTTLTGVSGAGQVGQVVAQVITYANVTGIAATGQIGTVTTVGKANVFPTGVVGTGEIGQVRAGNIVTVFLTGISSDGLIGQATTIGVANVFPTGVSSSGFAGQAIATGAAITAASGVQSIGLVGAVTSRAGASTILVGVQAYGFIGSPIIWGNIIPDGTVIYTPVSTGAGQVWSSVAPATAPSYTPVSGSGSTSWSDIDPPTNPQWVVVPT